MKSLNVDARLQQRLQEAELRLPEVDSELASPEVLSSSERLKDLGRERARLARIVTASRELRAAVEGHGGAAELLEEAEDPEMKALAEEELSVLSKRIEQLSLQVRELLIPRDPLEDRAAVIEIRAGTGAMKQDFSRRISYECTADSRSATGCPST